jgi:hypothetical protein
VKIPYALKDAPSIIEVEKSHASILYSC